MTLALDSFPLQWQNFHLLSCWNNQKFAQLQIDTFVMLFSFHSICSLSLLAYKTMIIISNSRERYFWAILNPKKFIENKSLSSLSSFVAAQFISVQFFFKVSISILSIFINYIRVYVPYQDLVSCFFYRNSFFNSYF